MQKKEKSKHYHITSFQIIILGFLSVILIGSLLLMLPIATRSGNSTSFSDALFTATSAVCVTGLIIHDTATYWSVFGQGIILLLIQIGGMGIVTIAVSIAVVSGRKIGLMQRSTMQEAIAAPNVGGIVRRTKFILKTAIFVELIGAAILAPVFCRDFGFFKGIWYALFHSISAFCNAGFDLMGAKKPFSSLTSYSMQPVVNTTIMVLIVIGGIGFLTWEDIKNNKWHFKKYRMQSKVILVTSVILIIVPAIFFFLFDFTGLPPGEKILASLFQSVTPRTAGFNTADLTAMTESSKAIMILLMLVGGSPGSTAGGIKTTTLAVLILNAFSVCRKKNDTEVYGRRLECSAVKSASTIAVIYFLLFFIGGIIISTAESMPLSACLYETASAVGTVGLTLGVTPQLSVFSQFILIVLMYLGRVGGLTLIYAAISNKNQSGAKLPLEKITVG